MKTTSKLVEAYLESVVVQVLRDALKDYDNVQIVGTWEPSTDDRLKGEENKAGCIVGVKSYPRTYDTPTVPYCQINFDISMAVRADVDWNGNNYLDLTSIISEVLQGWQNDFNSLYIFGFPDLFEITGFQLTGGDCGIDREEGIWQFQQSFAIFGIVSKPTTNVPNYDMTNEN